MSVAVRLREDAPDTTPVVICPIIHQKETRGLYHLASPQLALDHELTPQHSTPTPTAPRRTPCHTTARHLPQDVKTAEAGHPHQDVYSQAPKVGCLQQDARSETPAATHLPQHTRRKTPPETRPQQDACRKTPAARCPQQDARRKTPAARRPWAGHPPQDTYCKIPAAGHLGRDARRKTPAARSPCFPQDVRGRMSVARGLQPRRLRPGTDWTFAAGLQYAGAASDGHSQQDILYVVGVITEITECMPNEINQAATGVWL
ncbi:hypothetical protein K438DRAFT_1755237 [Mycena galopus ATCC 62051]|nr:hypothetical protein K438DRAFT_1755237 [Mycena galopus ATCC 62051]